MLPPPPPPQKKDHRQPSTYCGKKNEQIKDIISDNYLKKEIFKKWLSDVLLKKEKKLKKTIIV